MEYKQRWEEGVRWIPMQFLLEDGRCVPYISLDSMRKDVARHVTSLIYRVANFKDPL